jgi:hypothetical protein
LEVDEEKIKEHQQKVQKDLMRTSSPRDLFTIFSIINSEGDILFDGKHGVVTEEKREQHEIPSLKSRDYVQQIFQGRDRKFICGSPVIGSTSKKFMIPVGISLGDYGLTFGIEVPEFMRMVSRKQMSHGIVN